MLVELTVETMSFGKYVRSRRGALGITQRELADKLGRDQGWISTLENDRLRVVPDPETMNLLASSLRVSEGDLLHAWGYLHPDEDENNSSTSDPEITQFWTARIGELSEDDRRAVENLVPTRPVAQSHPIPSSPTSLISHKLAKTSHSIQHPPVVATSQSGCSRVAILAPPICSPKTGQFHRIWLFFADFLCFYPQIT